MILEWHASEHYDSVDTFHTIEAEERRSDSSDSDVSAIGMELKSAWDFFHINTIDKDAQENYYVSSRCMQFVTCFSPLGDLLWVLGGKRNKFMNMSEVKATNVKFQHHARTHENKRPL